MTPAWVFDFDGTLSNTDHRKHFLTGLRKDWDGWYAAANKDPAHRDIIKFTWLARKEGIVPVICTGRGEEYRDQSEEWLFIHNVNYDKMYMRAKKDRRDDTIIKKELVDLMRQDGYDPVLVFEDRDRVVKMWRDLGIRCLQVSPGNF